MGNETTLIRGTQVSGNPATIVETDVPASESAWPDPDRPGTVDGPHRERLAGDVIPVVFSHQAVHTTVPSNK